MKILVIGSEGTIGRPLVEKLIYDGHTVYTSDLQHHHHCINGQDEGFTRCDISKYREVENVLLSANFDYIYILAAEFGRINGEEFYDQVWETNVIGLKNILSVLEGNNITSKVIFFSSSEVYGELETPDGFLHEDDILKYPIIQHNDYAISKWVNEKQIINAQKQFSNLNIFRVRLFNAYGPMEFYTPYRSVVCLFCYRMLYNLPITIYKDYYRVFMYVDDLINTLAKITKVNWVLLNGNVFNIGGTEYCSVEDMFDVIYKNLPNYDTNNITYLNNDLHNTVCKRPDISLSKSILFHDPKTELSVGIPKTLEWMKKAYEL